jgi:WD40 repeat protein
MNHLVSINASNVLNIQKIYQWDAHEARVTSLMFVSPDNRLVSTAQNGSNRIPAIRLWHISSGSVNPEGRNFEDAIASAVNIPQVQLSENGRLLAAAHAGATLWDVLTRQRIGNIRAPASSAFQYGSNNVLVGSSNGVVTLWAFNLPYGSTSEYRETGILPEDYVYRPSPSELITAFQVGEAVVQVAHADNISFILTQSGNLLKHTLMGGAEMLTHVSADSPGGEAVPLADSGTLMVLQRDKQQVIYAAPYQDVQIYDYANQQTIERFPINAEVGCIAADHQLIIIGDADGWLHFLNAENYETIGQVNTQQPVTSCVFSLDGVLLVTGNANGEVVLWGIRPQ